MWSWFITKSCSAAAKMGSFSPLLWEKMGTSPGHQLSSAWRVSQLGKIVTVPFLKASWRAKWYEMSCFATWRHRWRSCKPAGYFSQVSKLSSGEGSRLDNWKEWVHTKHFEHLSGGVYLTVKPLSPTISFESTLIARSRSRPRFFARRKITF